MRGKTIINDTKTKIKELNWLNPFLREFYFQSIERSQNNIIEIKKKIKNSKNDYEKSKKFKQLNDLFGSDINGFWREVKKMQKLKQLINVPLK